MNDEHKREMSNEPFTQEISIIIIQRPSLSNLLLPPFILLLMPLPLITTKEKKRAEKENVKKYIVKCKETKRLFF